MRFGKKRLIPENMKMVRRSRIAPALPQTVAQISFPQKLCSRSFSKEEKKIAERYASVLKVSRHIVE